MIKSDEKPGTYQMLVNIFGEKTHLFVQVLQSKEQHQMLAGNLMKQLLNVSTCISTRMIF